MVKISDCRSSSAPLIHDLTAAMEYATRLQSLRNQYQSRLEIVMRTYFEKRRTGCRLERTPIPYPDLNGSYRVNHGRELARHQLLQVNELGVTPRLSSRHW
ncbi:hypothetical protein ACNKHM_25720 [Shigella sonnei]